MIGSPPPISRPESLQLVQHLPILGLIPSSIVLTI